VTLGDRIKRVVGNYGADLRARRSRAVDSAAPALAERLYALSDRVAFVPFRGEQNEVPVPVDVDGVRLDVVDDLAAYTGLEPVDVRSALERRDALSFRSEWWATPAALREDHWFYLSSKTYLFGNAVHFPDAAFVDRFVTSHVPAGGRVLDFGGGAGGLTLALAARGFVPAYSDLNALQRDFLRFRVHRHGLADRVEVLDWWADLPADGFDTVVAVDVLEHLPNARPTVARLLDAVRPGGSLVERSPFQTSASNPMHHGDFGLQELLAARGFELVDGAEDGTNVWTRRG
jgi:2-polyprenyl-3-methyl-5-hydroxy-6-metoxy-1,4-benzoquinol methylase